MYIRTKDGVYEVKVNKYHELVYCKNNQIVLSCNIINQSESLVELCDEIVCVDNSDNKPYRPFIIYGMSLEELNERQSGNKSVYGAIWTTKGLIYVAKMNDKWELELI